MDEQVLRFNSRSTRASPLNDADRFMLALPQITANWPTYAELTGNVGELWGRRQMCKEWILDETPESWEAEALGFRLSASNRVWISSLKS